MYPNLSFLKSLFLYNAYLGMLVKIQIPRPPSRYPHFTEILIQEESLGQSPKHLYFGKLSSQLVFRGAQFVGHQDMLFGSTAHLFECSVMMDSFLYLS